MTNWNANIDTRQPCWDGYRDLLARLHGPDFPDADRLSALLPAGTVSGGGAPLRFVAAGALPGVAYERHIFATGQVPTRERNGHDLFNALAWCRWPLLKAAMNAAHCHQLNKSGAGCQTTYKAAHQTGRGPLRDALTLLDESGALVIARNRTVLQTLARRDWLSAFQLLRCAWQGDVRVVLCGHALLEKSLAPYKSLTAHALLLHLAAPSLQGEAPLRQVDAALAERLSADALFAAPSALAPLPLAGIPGWWSGAPQDAAFYADVAVFRPPPVDLRPAPVHSVENPQLDPGHGVVPPGARY
jgi:hypothetical protein